MFCSQSFGCPSWTAGALGTLVVGLVSPLATASLIAEDGFESYTPTATFIGENGGAGWAGAYVINGSDKESRNTAQSVSLSYSNGSISSDGASIAGQYLVPSNQAFSSVFSRALPAITSDVVYMSMLLKHDSASGTPDDFIQFGLSETNANDVVQASFFLNNATFGVRSQETTSSATRTDQIVAGLTPTNGQTYLMVLKAEKVSGSTTYNKVSLIIDPDDLVEANNTITTVNADTGMDLSTSGHFIFRRSGVNTGDVTLFDNIKVGTTFERVVTIPEPGSISLAAIGAACLLSSLGGRPENR